MAWWLGKLNNNFTFDSDLKIALGYKLNAMNIISATSGIPVKKILPTTVGTILLCGKPHHLTIDKIAATGAGQPSTKKLEDKYRFDTKTSKKKCLLCP